ncbi:MAG: fucose isomerase [Armatimonadetes bacterium]|nr:fucose isomerase [Armatimonadota bacterium]
MPLPNAPEVKLALVAVSRDCFPIELSRRRLGKLAEACKKLGINFHACSTIIENEKDIIAAIDECSDAGANAAVIYLGNFGPEGPLAIFAEMFPGPAMACGAAEESSTDLIDGRGDAFCGMLNASYNFALRGVPVHIPQMPIGLPEELAPKIRHFANVARVALGLMGLKIFAFGPRPQDFYACNAPIKPLYDLGIEVMENSELDLLALFNSVDENDPEIAPIVDDMTKELGPGNTYPDLLPRLARFELALTRFAEENLGSRDYAVFANKCWPAFEPFFGFVPCYVNGRLSAKGMPVACEVDIYGAFSEYIAYLASETPATLLDINNTVPTDMIQGQDLKGAEPIDLFMGFHCGNTPSCCMKNCSMKFQVIMKRLMEEPGSPPSITRGTLDGQLRPGPATWFRLQADADNNLVSYIAEGNILDIDPKSHGGIGIFAIPNFARFYRHVVIGKRFPHHGAVAFQHCGKVLWDAVKLIGVYDINIPLPKTMLYPGENPFEVM